VLAIFLLDLLDSLGLLRRCLLCSWRLCHALFRLMLLDNRRRLPRGRVGGGVSLHFGTFSLRRLCALDAWGAWGAALRE
jgi:hypothetical protein